MQQSFPMISLAVYSYITVLFPLESTPRGEMDVSDIHVNSIIVVIKKKQC